MNKKTYGDKKKKVIQAFALSAGAYIFSKMIQSCDSSSKDSLMGSSCSKDSGKNDIPDLLSTTVAYLKKQTDVKPDIGIICGSGLGGLAEKLDNQKVLDYSLVPGFSKSTVEGHDGKLIFGVLGGKNVICMKGRFHFYEGYQAHKVAYPVKVMCAMGVKMMIVTNAAGGLNENFEVGDLMILNDHICFLGMAGINPLVGPVDTRCGPRFPPCNQYLPRFQNLFENIATQHFNKSERSPIQKGTYVGLSGPNYETPAEIKFLRVIGGDAVGMSTVFEVQMAAQCGIPAFGLSLITNKCKGPDDLKADNPNHEEVLEAANKRKPDVQHLVSVFVEQVDLSQYDRPRLHKIFFPKEEVKMP